MCVLPIVDKLDLCGHAFFPCRLSFSGEMSFLILSLLVRIVVVVFVDKLGDQRVGVCTCVQPIVDKLVLYGHAFFLSFELLWEIHVLSLWLLVRIVVVAIVDKRVDQRVGVCMCVQTIVDKLDRCGHVFSLSFELLWENRCLSFVCLVCRC